MEFPRTCPKERSMSTLIAVLAAASLASSALPPPAPVASSPRAAAARPAAQQKIWLSEEVEALRHRGLISIIGEESAVEPAAPELVAPAPAPRLPKEQDPEWYLERMSEPRAELARVQETLASLRRNLRCACASEGGINVDLPSPGITPEDALRLLSARAHALRAEIGAIEEEALRRGLAPGHFR